MKKSTVLAIVGLAAAGSPAWGTGTIYLDNYNTYGPPVTYGPGGLGPVGTGLNSAWTAGVYYTLGNVLSQVAPDPTGYADPTTLYAGLLLATGPGSTAPFNLPEPGTFLASAHLVLGGNPDDTITAMVVAYTGADYSSSLYRGHSEAFTLPLSNVTNPNSTRVGYYMPAFSVPIPEPATLALGGLSGLALLLLRRKQG